jgi:hypothetical protein
LDFLVIGAQKCATTTLFELLRQHPRVKMPLEKEVPVFTNANLTAEQLDAYCRRYFPGAQNHLLGKVTPQYMGDHQVPARIAALAPQCKLIALLRDPLERTRSHYRMAQRRGTEERSFDSAIAPLLESSAANTGRCSQTPSHANGYESEADFYLAWSEYGRILSAYRRYFPAQQLLVLYTENLERDPRGTLDRVLDFLALDRDFSPQGLGEVMHAGGGSNRIPHEARVWLRERQLVRGAWDLVPDQLQGRLRFLYERWNTHREAAALPLSSQLEPRVRRHFAEDLAQLARLGVDQPPWLEHYACATGEQTPCGVAA